MSKNKNKPQAKTSETVDATSPKRSNYEAAGKRYWKNRIHFLELGTVDGKVTELQEDMFYASSPDSDIMEWTSKTDPIAAEKAERKADAKRRAGILEE